MAEERELILKLGQKVTNRIGHEVTTEDSEYQGLASVLTDEMAGIALSMKVRKPMTAEELAKKNQMGVEVEFDNRIMSKNNEDYRNRLINYLRVIRKNKLSPKYMSVAFYQGNDGFYQLITSKDMKDQELVKLLIHFLIGSHYH